MSSKRRAVRDSDFAEPGVDGLAHRVLELLVAGVRLLDGGRQRLQLLAKGLAHALPVGGAGRPESFDLRHHRGAVAIELSLDGRDETRSHVVQFGCHTSRSSEVRTRSGSS